MSEKKNLAQLLRSADVYGKPPETEKSPPWQEALLQQFDHPQPELSRWSQPGLEQGPVPLQWHHVLTMAPAGLGLFLAGWLAGQNSELPLRLMEIPVLAWVGCSIALSAGLFGWWKLRFHS